MTTWDNILRLKFLFHKSRIVSRFVNSVKPKYINEKEGCLTPLAFYRNDRDKKEISVFCIDKYLRGFSRQNNKIWVLGDRIFEGAKSGTVAVARGDLFTKTVENICYDKDNKYTLFLVPAWFDLHCNIKPRLEDFHEDDVRVDKLADASYLIKRN